MTPPSRPRHSTAKNKKQNHENSPMDSETPDEKTINSILSFYRQEKLTECEKLIRSTLEQFPQHGLLWKVLGAILHQQGHLKTAISAMQTATQLLPHDHEAFNNLGISLKESGALVESEKSFLHALKLHNQFAEAHNNLGVTLLAQGKLNRAKECFQKAVQLQPDYIEACCNLGICQKDLGNYQDAEYYLRHTLELNPSYATGYNNLGNLYLRMSRLSDAKKALLDALKLKPDFAKAHNNLGNVFQGQGYLKKAEQSYLHALGSDPDYTDAFDGLLFVSNYHPDKSAGEIYKLYREYNSRFGTPEQNKWLPHGNDTNPERRLKIGYVSPAFLKHPVFNFLQPLLKNHDKKHFEIYAYAEVAREDDATLECKKHIDHWIATIGMTDDELARRIRRDKIDILVDLAGHTGKNRLQVFARKPAPVSLHWLDFGYTTGLTSIDYYLTDIHTAPVGSEHLFSEQLWRLPVPPFTYRPTKGMGAINPLPASEKKYITFGTLTRSIRLNPQTIAAWAEILKRVEHSRLIIDSHNFKDLAMQKTLKASFLNHGIDSCRLDIGYHSPPWDIIRSFDIGLDCFPHNSGTTLFECLYMGVPFITYASRPGVGRIGSSILAGVKYHEWIAHSVDEYINKTVELATNIPELVNIRSTLRKEILKSPLMDEKNFALSVENAYRAMFTKWSATVKSKNQDSATSGANATTLYNEAIDLHINNHIEAAQKTYIEAINLKSDLTDAYSNLGVLFQQKQEFENAIQCFNRALTLRPGYTDAQFNLANTYKLQPDLFRAEEAYRKVIMEQPDNADAHYNLGNILQEQGRIEEAERSLLRALEIKPEHRNAFSTLLFVLNYHPGKTSKEIFAAYKQFNTTFCRPLHRHWRSHLNKPNPNRRIRVGYMAPDYSKHPARYFLHPLLANHNKKTVELFAYINTAENKATEDLFQPYVDNWTSTLNLSNQQVYDTIINDKIDILVDLAGHTSGNRLQVFARKPAPVSLHWLDYGYTTGLTAIDYYLTDSITVPQESENYFSEKIWRIETPALAYRPPKGTGKVNKLPAVHNKYISFGTLTRAVRINHRTIRVWSKILKQCQGSKLIINSGSFEKPALQTSLTASFKEYGIDKNRLEFGCNSPPWDVLRRIDIMLDCFPHNSGTTLVESLYMGVPFITLADRPSMGTLGSSILVGVDHPEWISQTEDEYIALAKTLSSDLNTLAETRANLRREMERSSLMDESGFTQKIEIAYTEMFKIWCKKQQNNTRKQHTTKKKHHRQLPQQKIKELTNLFNAGKHNKATQLALSLTKKYPHHGAAWKILGPLLFQQGEKEKSLQAMEKATLLLPKDPDTHYNLGIAKQEFNLLNEAETCYTTAINLNKKHLQAHGNLAELQRKQGHLTEAITSYQYILGQNPHSFEVHCCLGNIFKTLKETSKAIESYQSALRIQPDSAEPLNNLSIIYKEQGLLDQAEAICQKALASNPQLHEAHNNLGLIYQEKGLLTQAAICYRRALAIRHDYTISSSNLALCLQQQNKLVESEQICNEAIMLNNADSKLWQNLALTQIKTGDLDKAEGNLLRAIQLKPDYMETYSNLLFLLNNHPDKTSEDIYIKYTVFNRRFCTPVETEWRTFTNDTNIHRRLRVGYVSYNFRKHSTRHFLEPLLEQHNKEKIEIFIYTDLQNEDAVTSRYKAYADHWRLCTGLTDSEMADRIRTDNIDILVDLAGHTEKNRLLVFARKPAPVSLHWLDFGYTTGLTAIDYYLTDTVNVPSGCDSLFSEKPYRMEPPCIAYRPDNTIERVNSLPALKHHYITFGTLTRSLRINYKTIRVWVEILKRVRNSHLIINSSDFTDPVMQQKMMENFTREGIANERLHIGFHSPPWDTYRSLDIGLDCFPHNSGTTLVETLYMGIPFITLADRPSVGRLGSSILHSINHPEWIADSEEQYIQHAVSLAAQPSYLSTLRKSLRKEMENSLLMDEEAFAEKVEAAYQEMFQKWACETKKPGTDDSSKIVLEALQQASFCRESHLNEEARELYQSILVLDPHNSTANFNLGALLLEQHNPVDALPFLESAVNSQPEHGPHWLAYIDALDKTDKHELAYQLFDMARAAGLDGQEADSLKTRLAKNIKDTQ